MKSIANRIFIIIAVVITAMSVDAKHYVGGDISLLPSYEKNGAKYYDTNGKAISDMLTYFKDEELNAMRVRLFVDPTQATATEKGEGVVQSLEYILPLCKRIKADGFALMLDFHYSDTWADPVKQWTPASWQGQTDDELVNTIYNYTREVLTTLVENDATPDFIQTGNEISYGMLWGPRGDTSKKCFANRESNWGYFTTLLKSAGRACREVTPDAKIVLHTERANSDYEISWFYNQMKKYDVDYDIIGLSYYPYYHNTLENLDAAISKLEANYPTKSIMIVETGYYHAWQPSDINFDYSSKYPITPAGQKAFAQDLIAMLLKHPAVNGLFWWFMEANEYGLDWNTKRVTDNWYNAGLWDNSTGRALPAITVLHEFLEDSGIEGVAVDNPDADTAWYTISGIRLPAAPTAPGVYIHGGSKIVVKNP